MSAELSLSAVRSGVRRGSQYLGGMGANEIPADGLFSYSVSRSDAVFPVQGRFGGDLRTWGGWGRMRSPPMVYLVAALRVKGGAAGASILGGGWGRKRPPPIGLFSCGAGSGFVFLFRSRAENHSAGGATPLLSHNQLIGRGNSAPLTARYFLSPDWGTRSGCPSAWPPHHLRQGALVCKPLPHRGVNVTVVEHCCHTVICASGAPRLTGENG